MKLYFNKIKAGILYLVLILSFTAAKADEGMWLPLLLPRLNYVDMQKEGLHLTADEIYSINHSSLKDAIVQFGNGCTAEVVSDKGLLFTNHHCGYGSIQSQSTVEHDYLTDGFWAMRPEEELPIPGLTARFLVYMKDVTAAILVGVSDKMTETERLDKVKANIKIVEAAENPDKKYEVRTGTFFNGNEYYLFVYQVFRDVRLAGAPPSAIGKFGADTDNWMWPRHTGDFSVFRVYAGADNQPAEYSASNKPYEPKKHLAVSLKPKQKGDFAMIMGYPGTTDRYATSYTINWALEKNNPYVIKIRTKKLEILRQDMDAEPAVRIKYASKYAGTANYWKFFIGQNKGLKRLKVAERKQELEQQFADWIIKDGERMRQYREALPMISKAYETINPYEAEVRYYNEAILRGSDLFAYARQYNDLFAELQKPVPDQAAIDKMRQKIQKDAPNFFKDYNAPTDEKLFAAMLQLFHEDVPATMQPPYLDQLVKKSKGGYAALSRKIFASTLFCDPQKVDAFLAAPTAKALGKDPLWKLYKAFAANADSVDKVVKPANEMLAKGRRLFVRGLREMQPDTKFYPDANSTMRLTYGHVMDYSPADAVDYNFTTTLDGVMAKENPDSWEFVVPEKLKQLYRNKDYGRYGENGKLVVAYLTDNDITGGNSGSPVLNADGELTGLAFDGNWEAMSGNYAFEPQLQRTICVDIRYVLFVIDKYAGAGNLISELDIHE